MRLSRSGAQLIAGFEGFVPHPYNDAAGHATIGFGHLIHRGRLTAADVAQWGTISRDRGLDLLRGDAREAEQAVAGAVTVPLTQPEFDALVSFVFNVGAGAFRSSTLLRRLTADDRAGAGAELLHWCRAGGRVLEGLRRRREAEQKLMRSAAVSPLAALPPDERRWVGEYDRLKRAGKDLARRRTLRAAMLARRRAIWHGAQQSGWNRLNRRARYRALLTRTR
jgi:lysozyme